MEVKEMNITVGIPTSGKPDLIYGDKVSILKNMRIGLDFHWERSIEVRLPGEVVETSDPKFQLVNRLPIEEYLRCVVGSEMNPKAPIEFLKAHAVISRTWAVDKILHSNPYGSKGKIRSKERIISWEDTCDHIGFDVCSDDHCQRYQGLQDLHPEAIKALKDTEGVILLSRSGRPVDARFSKCCGGRSEIFSTCWQEEERESLESIADPWCDLTGLEDRETDGILRIILKDYDRANGGGFRWTATITAEQIRDNLRNKFGMEIGEIIGIEPIERGASGRIKRLRVRGTDTDIEIGKELMIRRLLSDTHLYSSWFDIQPSEIEKSWNLKGRGWGHGVGLCQIGAARMAMKSRSWEEILAFYYPGSRPATGI